MRKIAGRAPLTVPRGLPSGFSSVNASAVTCRPSAVGTSDVIVTVTDSNGVREESGALGFTVTMGAGTFLGLPALKGYAVAAGVAGFAIVALAVVVAQRSRRRRDPPAA